MAVSDYGLGIDAGQQKTALQQYIDQIIDNKDIEVIRGADRTVDFPSWAKPDINYEHQDASYRINSVLPFEEDRNKDAYIIYPKLGIIVPVLGINEEDKTLIREKKGFDHYKYLEGGSLHYIGYSPSQGSGNMVIAGHSSFFTKDAGRYKTAFQAVALSDIGDNVWYFEKNSKGDYDRYDYVIDVIDQVSTKDTSILYPRGDTKELTTYTCYPFGSTANRKYNKATFIGKREGSSNVLAKNIYIPSLAKKTTLLSKSQQIHSTAPIIDKLKKSSKKANTLQFRKAKRWKSKIAQFYRPSSS